MSQKDTKSLIEQVGQKFVAEVPALKNLAIVVKLDLQHRSDHQVYRVEFPKIEATKSVAADAKIEVMMMREAFNDIADPKHGLPEWIEAVHQGKVKFGGSNQLLKLVENVIERHQRRHGG